VDTFALENPSKNFQCSLVLLMNGADPDKKNSDNTAIYLAARSKDMPTVKMLIAFNADLNLEDQQRKTALHLVRFL
jgi:ankyrin repeat protein